MARSPSGATRPRPPGTFYSDNIAGAFAQAGSSIAEVGQQLGDWLKRNRAEDDRDDEK